MGQACEGIMNLWGKSDENIQSSQTSTPGYERSPAAPWRQVRKKVTCKNFLPFQHSQAKIIVVRWLVKIGRLIIKGQSP